MSLRTFDDAVVIMTGGASGIGFTMAAELVRRGAHVVLADRDVDGANAAASTLGQRATAMACDVTDPAQVTEVVDRTFDAHGRLDFLFNNAGIGMSGPVEQHRLTHWSRVLDVNLGGVVHGIEAAYPRMIEQGFGHIVNTASMAGFLPTPGFVSYGASKHAVVGLSAGLRIEAARHGVRVTALCPGFIRTPILTGGKYGGPVDEGADLSTAGQAAERFRPMDPVEFASKVVPRLARNPGVIILPWRWRVARWLYRLAPNLVSTIAGRNFDPDAAGLI